MLGIGKESWFWSIESNDRVAFCVWALRLDGLHVAPFDRHPNGNGMLRALGLTGESWHAWLTDVVHHADSLQGPHAPRPLVRGSIPPLMALTPADLWMGNPRVRALLMELWPVYSRLAARPPDDGLSPATHGSAKKERDMFRRMWHDLAPYRSHLDTLRVYTIDYPVHVRRLVPPVSVIIGRARDLQEDVTVRQDIVIAARQLTAITMSSRA
jgi:hypothetical protein